MEDLLLFSDRKFWDFYIIDFLQIESSATNAILNLFMIEAISQGPLKHLWGFELAI